MRSEPATAEEPRPRSGPALVFRDRAFGPYFWGTLASNCGTWVHNIASAVVVYQLTGSALLVGMVSVLQYLPTLTLSLWAGSVSDRFDRRLVLLSSQLFGAVSVGALAVWTLLVGIDGLPGAWPVLATAGLLGVAQAFMNPSMQALIPALVPRADLATAIGLNNSAFVLARAAGPALGAAILATGGPPVAFLFNALSFLAHCGVLWMLGSRIKAGQRRSGTGVLDGLRYLRRAAEPLLLIGGIASVGFAIDPVNTLTPSLAARFGGGDELVSALVFAFGIGAALGIAPLRALRRALGSHGAAMTGLGLLAAGNVLLSVSPREWMALLALLTGGLGLLLAVSSITGRLQELLPDELRGRVMAVWSISFVGSRALAAAANGAMADLVSVGFALQACAGMAVVGIGWVALARRAARTAG